MARPFRHRTPRLLHPGAWWIWAVGTAAAALRTTNPLLLLLIVAAVAYVVAARRQAAPWARSFGSFCKLALFVIVFRVVMQMFFGARVGTTVLFVLPSVELPSWAAGVSIGGPVSVELLLAAVYSSLQVGAVLVCFGAVNSLCSPYRLLRALPAVLYEAGVVVTVALAFAPQTVMAIGRVREARRLRGRPTKGLRGVRGMALPVLEAALERSVELAASMDARGYGRRGDLSSRARRVVTVATALGLLMICVGVYALLDVSAPRVLSLPILAIGSAVLAGGFFSSGRHSLRTRYRADPWNAAEWLVGLCGLGALGFFVAAGRADAVVLTPPLFPFEWPTVTVLPVLGAVCVLLPAWLSPPSPKLLEVPREDAPPDDGHAPREARPVAEVAA